MMKRSLGVLLAVVAVSAVATAQDAVVMDPTVAKPVKQAARRAATARATDIESHLARYEMLRINAERACLAERAKKIGQVARELDAAEPDNADRLREKLNEAQHGNCHDPAHDGQQQVDDPPAARIVRDGFGMSCWAETCKVDDSAELEGKAQLSSLEGKALQCYEAQLHYEPKLMGKLGVALTVKDGDVIRTHVTEDTVGSRDLIGCLAEDVRSLSFSKVADGMIVRSTWGFAPVQATP